MNSELIRLNGLSKFYTGSQSVVIGLNNISLSLSRGEFVAITGESGSGKSTLSHVLSGILPYESGELYFDGYPTSHFDSADWEQYRREHISFISQNYGILPGVTVLENVVSALMLTGMAKQEAQAAAENLLKQVELWQLRHRRAAKLSSGQKQRLSIARALAKPAPVLIADEPTGNLDQENSAKVIDLLAQAAKDRLVILVTHEFSEAKDAATRHIVLQDGKVVMDAALREPNIPGEMASAKSPNQPMGFYIARLQQRSRPVWSGFMAMFFTLTALAVFVFLGTFIVNLDDSHTRLYDPSVFQNGDPQRIVVNTLTGEPMTEEDYRKILSAAHVEQLEPNGYVTDLQYGYREKLDYKLVTYETSVPGPGRDPIIEVRVYARIADSAPYIQTVPVMPQGKTFLTAGREPENIYEVVAQGGPDLIGKTMMVYIAHSDYWTADRTLPLEVTVVGVTDQGSDLYFHRDLGRLCVQVIKTASSGFTFLPAADLDDDHFRGHQELVTSMESLYVWNLETAARNRTIEAVTRKDDKIFTNINSILELDPEMEESVTMQIVSNDLGGYYLYHAVAKQYFYYHGQENGWVFKKTTDPSPNQFLVQFYPVDGEAAEGAALTSGRYVIWSPHHNRAVSSVSSYLSGPSPFMYNAVPVTMENGVLTGYTDADIWDVQVEQGQIVSISHGENMLVSAKSYETSPIKFETYWVAERAIDLIGIHDINIRRLVEVSPARFDQLTWNSVSEQVSVTITDFGYTDRVLAELQSMGYAALSPYQLGSVKQDPQLAQQREQTLMICLLALAAVTALQIILLRAMFTAQMESYRLLSNIGLSARMAHRSILWQNLGFAVLGQFLTAGILAVCQTRGVARIVHILHYLPMGYVALLMAVHLAVSACAVLWVCKALNRQVYPQVGREADLPVEEERGNAE